MTEIPCAEIVLLGGSDAGSPFMFQREELTNQLVVGFLFSAIIAPFPRRVWFLTLGVLRLQFILGAILLGLGCSAMVIPWKNGVRGLQKPPDFQNIA